MLSEPLRRAEVGTGRLAALFGLTALPLGANAIGHTTPYLLDLSHEPIGVAAFGVGTLFATRGRLEEAASLEKPARPEEITWLEETSQVGRWEEPALVLSAEERIRNYNRRAARVFPALGREKAVGRKLGEVLPDLERVLSEKTSSEEAPSGKRQVLKTEMPKAGERPKSGGRKEAVGREEAVGWKEVPRYFQPVEPTFQWGTGRLVVLADVTERELRRQGRESRLEAISKSIPGLAFEFRAGRGDELSDTELSAREQLAERRSVEFIGGETEMLFGPSSDLGATEVEATGPEGPTTPGALYDWFVGRIPEPHREEFVQSVEEAIEEQTRWQEEFPFDRPGGPNGPDGPGGERIWLLGSAEPEAEERPEGRKIVLQGTLIDITERKRQEQELKQADTAFRNAQDALFVIDVERGPEGDWEFTLGRVNSAYEVATGLSPEDLCGRSPGEIVGQEVGREVRRRYQSCARRQEPIEYEEELPIGEETTYWQTRIAPVVKEGKTEQLVGATRDVTQRRRREEKLKESRRELRREKRHVQSITENVSDGIYRSTKEEGIVYANQAFIEMMGYRDLQDLREAETEALYANPGRREELIEKEAEEGRLNREEVRFRRKDGSTFVGLFSSQRAHGKEEDKTYFDGAITDITEQKRRKRELERQNDLFEKAQDIAGVGAWEYDVRAEALTWTEEVYRIHDLPTGRELTPEEALGFYHPEDRPRVASLFGRAVEDGKPYSVEARLITEQGETRWTRTRGEPQRGDDGEIARVRGTTQDITERKRREGRLEKQSQTLREIQENVSDVVWITPPDKSEMEFISRAYEEIWERPVEKLKKRPEAFVEAIHPEDRPRVEAALETQSEDPESYEETYRVVQPGGEVRWVRDRSSGVYNEEGRLERIIGVATDITDRKRRDRALQERQEKIESLYGATSKLLRAETESEVPGLLAAIVDDALGYPATTIRLAEGDRLEPTCVLPAVQNYMPKRPAYDIDGSAPAAQAYRAGESRVYDDLSAEAETKGLNRGDIRATAYVPMGSYGLISVGTTEVGGIGAFDRRLMEVLGAYAALVLGQLGREEELISAREKAEKARREAEESRQEAEEALRKAEAASQAKSAFLANMSHEIRTPLTSVIGFAESISAQAEELDLPGESPLPKHAELIEKGGKRLLKTLEGILNLSKLEAGQMELDARPVDLAAQVEQVAEELRPKAQKKGLTLTAKTGEEAKTGGEEPLRKEPLRKEALALADEGGVQIILQNLLSNAIKYTKEGEVEVRTHLENGHVVLEVEDTGIGMEPAVAEDLFEPFRQASEGWSREYEGTGVGLAVTKKAAEEMGGSVEVEAQKGEGSRFTVRLPRAELP